MARGRYNKRGRGGGGGRGRGGRGRGGSGRGGGGNFLDNRQSYDAIKKNNEKFERFYNTLNIVPSGPEREALWAALRRELPNSFRFTGSKGHALLVRDNLVDRFFPILSKITYDDKPVELPTEIPWFPEGLAYSMTIPKQVIRKCAPFKEFQKFLVSETGVGNISRQEHVSMIPPLLMDIKPHHAVLDLCAAPGSKSAQLVEAIHAGEEDRVVAAIKAANGANGANGTATNGDVSEDGGRAAGLLVANDVNYQRAQMLVHQVKRLNSPNLIVTNHDATMFPSIELPSPPPAPGFQKRGKYLKFDRILADVPCSGDGTARKNPNIWKDWTPQNGLGLYITQVRILTRSLQLLKVGGRVVYSTCSMNPVENEAIVSSAIERCGGVTKVKLLDCSQALPNLIRSKGLTDWSVMNRNGDIYESFAEAVQHDAQDSKIVPGMFPPESAEQIPLDNCMRVYPHQQDTGGFFIAVLEKLSEIKAKPETDSKCMKKDWSFTPAKPVKQEQPEPPVEPPQEPTFFQELLDEVDHPTTAVETTDDLSSSAARQNADVVIESPGSKRKAEDDGTGDGDAKRAKLGGLTELVSTHPIPPAVAMGVEASSAEPSAPIAQNGDSAVSGTVEKPTLDTVVDAPFEQAVPAEAQQAPPQNRRQRIGDDVPNEEAFKYLAPDHAELQTIYDFYDLHPSFPRDRFLVRNHAGDPVKGIYYSSQLVKDILTTNEGRGMKFVHAGVKMFMKQDAQGQDICRWRIQTEGLPIIEGWVGEKRSVFLTRKSTLRKLLVEMFPKIGSAASPEGDGWRALGEIGEQVLHLSMGCCVLRVQGGSKTKDPGGVTDEEGFREPLVLPLWRSLHSLNLMLPKEDRRAMLLRLYNEDVELINHSDAARKAKAAGGEEGKGSLPAEDDARELERRIESSMQQDDLDGKVVDDDDVADLSAQVASTVAPEVNENGVDLAAEALEQDVLQGEGRVLAQTMAEAEQGDVEVAEAMPQGEGEGDEVMTSAGV